MTTAVDLFAPQQPSPALTRLRRLSRPFEILFAGLAVLALIFLAGLAVGGAIPNPYLRIGPHGCFIAFSGALAGTIPVTDMSLVTRAVGLVAISSIFGAVAYAFWNLRALFAGYRRGEVFTEGAVAAMRRAGAGLIVFALAPALTQPVLRAVGSLDRAWFHGHSVAALITGAALFVLAAVFALGQEIAREAEGYV
ncbi:MAG: DUF2975 domain-containing protein [Caulobacteraceae bacterium]|nr:DUF2975 domain-containing protein [Caulobacteraceae bacterium]